MKRSPMRRTRRPADADVQAAYARCHARPRCEARVSPHCNGRNEHAHHRKMRSQMGPTTDDNLLAVCHQCHTWIHSSPTSAYAAGLLLHSWDEITPFGMIVAIRLIDRNDADRVLVRPIFPPLSDTAEHRNHTILDQRYTAADEGEWRVEFDTRP